MNIDIDKQETVVEILWDFAADQQLKLHDVINSEGVSVNTDAVDVALGRILTLFHLDVAPID